MRYYEISPLIQSQLAVFPGDVTFQRRVSFDFAKGDHLLLSAIESTLHLGAHADSEGHYHQAGGGIEQRRLESYFGPAQVVTVQVASGARIFPQDLKTKILASRVLIKTGSFLDPNQWCADFNSLSPELVDFLASEGVKLIGIDTPSVDPASSQGLESHQAIYRQKMAILEGLSMQAVPDGTYFLVALPLNIQGADASPVRAILIEGPELFPVTTLSPV